MSLAESSDGILTRSHKLLTVGSPEKRDALFGQLLLKFNLINEEQLKVALQRQAKLEQPKKLGEVLVEQGVVDAQTVAGILSVQRRKLSKNEATEETSELENLLQSNSPLEFLKITRTLKASDLHVTPGMEPRVRVHGSLVPLPRKALSKEEVEEFLNSFLGAEERARLAAHKFVDLAIEDSNVGRFRLNVFQHSAGLAGAFRIIPDRVWNFEELGLPVDVKALTHLNHGLVLVTGATGSGKSTTLAALIDVINRQQRKHIIALEEPIEFIHRNKKSVVTQREIPTHAPDFGQALRSALREDPDVIVVGEMRDAQTVITALTAAETGHLVFGTLHTQNAPQSIFRILDLFPATTAEHVRALLSNVLRGVISQQLIPDLNDDDRVLAYEFMQVNSAIANLIREGRVWQIRAAMQVAAQEGTRLMDDSLVELVESKSISFEEAYSRAVEKDKFLNLQGGSRQ